MKKLLLLIIPMLLLSCVSQKGIELYKGKTTLTQVQTKYNNPSKGESIEYYKTYTSETSGKKYDVYITQEKGLNENAKTVVGQMLNTAVRYLVFNSDNIYIDTVQNPYNIQKAINKL